MKRKFVYGLLMMFGFSFMSTTCSSDDAPSRDYSALIQEIKNTLQAENWKITLFIDSGQDETSHFNGYTLVFGNNGTITANNGANSINGSWSIENNDQSDDDNDSNEDNDVDFNIQFNAPADFTDLTEDWKIITRSATKIELIHISGGNGGTDILTLEKA